MKNDFSELSYEERNVGVSLAEQKTDDFLKSKNIFYFEFGFENQNLEKDHWFIVPRFFRNAPDRIVIHKKRFVLLEIKGCREELKIKRLDFESYIKWGKYADFLFSIYSNSTKDIYIVPLDRIVKEETSAPEGSYPDNNEKYFKINIDRLEKYKRSLT